jgi:hypothetical protein
MKFELGQVVWYIENNVVHSAQVVARQFVENLHNDWDSTKVQQETWQPFGEQRTKYATVDGVYNEDQLFASRKELGEFIMGFVYISAKEESPGDEVARGE